MATMSDINQQSADLLFGVRRSVRYHSRRVRFYDSLHQATTFLALLFGSATVATFSGAIAIGWPLWVKLAPAVAVSVLAALNLVAGSVAKARLHTNLMRDFVALEQSMATWQEEPSAEQLAQATAKRLGIESAEPPVLRVLDTLCHNEMLLSMGENQNLQIEVGRWQRLFANWFDFAEHKMYAQTEMDAKS